MRRKDIKKFVYNKLLLIFVRIVGQSGFQGLVELALSRSFVFNLSIYVV